MYSGTAIRGDGNCDVAARIASYDPVAKRYSRPYTVLLAWCAVDGALLAPAKPFRSEAIEDILADLDPLIDDLKEDRLGAGLDLIDAAPVSHSTDSYGKHRNKLDQFYIGKFPDLGPRVESATPRATRSEQSIKQDQVVQQ